jgi:hypothetical protein
VHFELPSLAKLMIVVVFQQWSWVNQRSLFQLGTPVHQLHHGSRQRLLNDDMFLWVVMIGTMKKCSLQFALWTNVFAYGRYTWAIIMM